MRARILGWASAFAVLAAPASAAAQLTPESVGETAHEIDVTLRHGLARVTERIRLRNREPGAVEACYALTAGRPVAVVALQACRGRACRAGLRADPAEAGVYRSALSSPARTGRPIAIAHGSPTGARVCVAPVDDQGAVELQLTWVARTESHRGTTTLVLPARASARLGEATRRVDAGLTVHGPPRYAVAPLTVRAPDHAVVRAPAQMRADQPLRIEADLGAGAVTRSVASTRCGDDRCVRVHLAAAPDPARMLTPRDVVLAFDVSGSMEAIATERTVATADAVLVQLPRGSTVRALAYGARASWIWAEPRSADEARAALTTALVQPRPVGTTTRFGAVWDLVRPLAGPSRPEPLLVVAIGDGQLEDDDASPLPASGGAAPIARGVEVAYLSVGDRLDDGGDAAGVAHRTRGAAIHVGGVATIGGEALADRVAAALGPAVLAGMVIEHDGERTSVPTLRAGEDLEVIVRGDRVRVLAGARALPVGTPAPALARALRAHAGRIAGRDGDTLVAASRFDLVREGKAQEAGQLYVPREGAGIAVAPPAHPAGHRGCRCGGVEVRGGLSRETVRRMMHHALPRVRACFAEERAGRSDWSARVLYTIVLAGREARSVVVEGATSERHRACLVAAADDLVVPDGDGSVVVVRYPFAAHAVPDPAAIDLREDVAESVDDVIDALSSVRAP